MPADYRQYPFAQGRHPRGWAETTVGQVLLGIQSGFSSGKHNQTGEGIPHLRPMSVSPLGEITLEGVRYIAPDAGGLRLTEDDVLFTNTSSTAWVGKTAVVRRPGNWAFSNHMTRLRLGTGMNPEFVARQLHYLCMCGYFAFHCKKHINQSSIAGQQLAGGIPFRCPPGPEQTRITSKLTRLLKRERNLREALEALLGLLQDYRAAVFSAACQGRLVRCDKRKWKQLTLEGVCSKITDGDHQPPPQVPDGIAFLTIGNISSGRLDFSETRFVPKKYFAKIKAVRIPKRNDVLYSIVGASLGIPVLVNTDRQFCFQRHIALLKPSTAIVPKFLWLFMSSPETFQQTWTRTTGAAQPTLPLSALRSLPISLPPLAEQMRIVAEIDRRLSALTGIENEIRNAIEQTSQLRTLVFHHALSGSLVAQDESDGTALELLARIEHERLQRAKEAAGWRKPRTPKKEPLPMLTLEDIKPTHLADILRQHGRPLDARALWLESQLSVDDFYAQLKKELGKGVRETGTERHLEAKA